MADRFYTKKPKDPVIGTVFMDTMNDALYVYDGSKWKRMMSFDPGDVQELTPSKDEIATAVSELKQISEELA